MKWVDRPTILEHIGVAGSTLYTWMATGKIPKPVRGQFCVEQVDLWMLYGATVGEEIFQEEHVRNKSNIPDGQPEGHTPAS